MPRRRQASAAMRVLVLNGPDLWYDIFKHIKGTRILLGLRLVCQKWAIRMLYLKKTQFIMFHKAPLRAQLTCLSIWPLILYLRKEWENQDKKITDHVLLVSKKSKNTKNMKYLPVYDRIRL